MSKASRDEMITVAMEALEQVVEADAASLFLHAAVVVDALLARYKIKPRPATEGT